MQYTGSTMWLKDSGLTVNETNMEVCLFHAKDHPLVTIRVNGVIMNGLTFQRTPIRSNVTKKI